MSSILHLFILYCLALKFHKSLLDTPPVVVVAIVIHCCYFPHFNQNPQASPSMLSSESSSSNWDFTPVINLLHSPTYRGGGGGGPLAAPRPCEISASSSSDELKPVNISADTSLQGSNSNITANFPKLGDFSSVWEFLNKATTSTSARTAGVEPPRRSEAINTSPQLTSQCPRFTILKRPSEKVKKVDVDQPASSPPRTPPRAILIKGNSVSKRNYGPSNDAILSDSSVEVDSDGNHSVFDPPLSGKRCVCVRPQVGAAASGTEPCGTPPSSCSEGEGLLNATKAKYRAIGSSIRIQPIAYKSASERRVGLLTKLLAAFPDYAETVSGIRKLAATGVKASSVRPIHVFVDMSNIMVGFHDAVKLTRDIPVTTRIRRLPLSFHNFSLILERGRPTAKRALVGSDRFAAIDEAEKIGYETNILDRVQKVKYQTPRQVKYRRPNATSSADTSGSSETNSKPGERWVEQGVDEILHLKILESLIDTEEPATIVLATGDAAEAEYSGGFMRMVERALQRGWNIELVSFWQITSYAYRKKEFRAKWRARFRLIKLDDYIEELLDI